jgi:hypothetical protein
MQHKLGWQSITVNIGSVKGGMLRDTLSFIFPLVLSKLFSFLKGISNSGACVIQ